MAVAAFFSSCCFMSVYVSLVCGSSETGIHDLRACVFHNWLHWYEYPRQHLVRDINATLCSHIIFYGVTIKDSRVVITDPYNDNQTKELVDLRRRHKSLKVIVSLGGQHYPWQSLSAMMKTSTSRTTFVASIIAYVRTRRLDGLHLDFPFTSNTRAVDKRGFTHLIRGLRTGFQRESARTGRPRFELTASVSCRKAVIVKSYEITNIAKQLDWISLRTFNFDSDNEGMTAHQAPLRYGNRKEDKSLEHNVEWAVRYWLEAGVDRSRLVLGISFDAAAYELVGIRYGFWVPQKGAAVAGYYTNTRGRLSYYEVCEYLTKGSLPRWDSMSEVPYTIYDGWLWLGYENTRSISVKLSWMRGMRLGGWMAWHLASDDFHGTFCGDGIYPLLRALNEKIVADYTEPTSGSNTMRRRRYPRFFASVLYATAALVLAVSS